jgi:hypothetical protein
VNKAFRKYLTDSEVELIESTKPTNLSGLDEDELGDLHDRVRRASRKYRKLHRRQASAQVRADRGRGKAAAKNQRSVDALARVSRSLSKAAKDSAAELKAERLALAQAGSAGPQKGHRSSQGSTRGGGRTPAKKRTPATKKRQASTLAAGARRQAKRDAR